MMILEHKGLCSGKKVPYKEYISIYCTPLYIGGIPYQKAADGSTSGLSIRDTVLNAPSEAMT